MKKTEFTKYLRKQYYPSPETAKDSLGGYLVPGIILKNKTGWLSCVYRWFGLQFKNEHLYKKGVFSFNLRKAIIDAIEKGQ